MVCAATLVRCVKSTGTLRLSSGSFQSFEGSQRFHPQSKAALPSGSKQCDTPKRPRNIHQLTKSSIPEDLNLQKHSCANSQVSSELYVIWQHNISFFLSQIKHQLDATLCRFYFCRVILHVSGASAHHQEYLKLVQRPLVRVLLLQVSHNITLLGPKLGPNKEMWWLTCNDNTHTSDRCTSFKYSLWWALAPEKRRVTLQK